MKQKADQEVVTKGFFRRELKKELQNYPTKNDLQLAIQASEARTDIKMDQRFEKYEDKMINALLQLKSDIFAKIDSFLGEVEENRIERQDLKNVVHDHEKRITKIERFQRTA